MVASRQNAGAVSVALELSTDEMVDLTTERGHFVYEKGATVISVRPSRGIAETPGQVITVAGRHFKESSGLSCHFGVKSIVLGEHISSTLVSCSVPARGHGTVSLGVSNNGMYLEAMTCLLYTS